MKLLLTPLYCTLLFITIFCQTTTAQDTFDDNIRFDPNKNFFQSHENHDDLIEFAYQHQKDVIGEYRATQGKYRLISFAQDIANSFSRYDLVSIKKFTQDCFKKITDNIDSFSTKDERYILKQFSEDKIVLDCDTSDETFYLIAYFVQKAHPHFEILDRIQFINFHNHQTVVLTSGNTKLYGELFTNGQISFFNQSVYLAINPKYSKEPMAAGGITVLKSMMLAAKSLHYMDQQDYANAIELCEQAIKVHGKNTCAMKNLARYLCWNKEYSRAIDSFKQYFNYKSFSGVDYYWLGTAYMGARQFDNASQQFQMALKFEPNRIQYQYALNQAKERVRL